MNAVKYLKKYSVFMFSALFINSLILLGISQLALQKKTSMPRFSYNPVYLMEYKEPDPPEIKKKISEIKEKEPTKLPKVNIKQKRLKPSKPNMNLNLPLVNIDLNPLLKTDMGIPIEAFAPSPSIPNEFDINNVDQIPRIVRKIEPLYPHRAKRLNIKGKVIIKFLVSCNGYVQKPKIIKATPQGIFEQSVLNAICKWRFKPGYYQGKAVATWVELPIMFNLNG